MTRVSVVVPTFERPERLPGLIAALEAQTLPADQFDVIVADDGSRDETPAVLADLASRTRIRMRVVRNERNRGPAVARNLGWRTADAPIIAFTDDDCQPAPGWLTAGLARMEKGSAPIVQGRTMPDPSVKMTGWAKTMQVEELSIYYQSCNIFYRTEVLRAVDGFDEQTMVPTHAAGYTMLKDFAEDTTLGWKARSLGFMPEFAPDALVHHAVTYPGLRYWWKYALAHRAFATLARRFPEMRRDMFWLRVFLGRDRALFDAAVAGLFAGIVWRPALALAVPYLYIRRPRHLTTYDVKIFLTWPLYDAMKSVGLAVGSLKERTLVL